MSDKPTEYLFFYGHSSKNEDGYLSNWFESSFELDGIHYPTTEHYMMYWKAKLMGDEDTAELIKNCKTPKQAKALGRKVKPWNEKLWIANRERIMFDGLVAKFQCPDNAELKEKLLSTHPKVLVEASPYDKIWGIGMRKGAKGVEDPKNWKGLNLLGKALVQTREFLLQ